MKSVFLGNFLLLYDNLQARMRLWLPEDPASAHARCKVDNVIGDVGTYWVPTVSRETTRLRS